jgi:hypothetical protein
VGCYECLRIRPKSESTHHIRGAVCDCPSYGFRKFCGHLDVFDKSERITLDKKGIFPLFALKVLGEVLDPLYNEFCYKSMEEDWLRISEFLKTAPEEKRIHGISLTVLPPSPMKLIHIWLAQKN